MIQKGLKQYQAITKSSLKEEISSADPHRIIQLLMQGVIDNLSKAKGAIDINDAAKKSEYITKASTIIQSLDSSLDKSVEAEVVQQLADLYSYMRGQLAEAMLQPDKSKALIDEVARLMITIKEGWDQISEEDKQAGYQLQAERSQQ